MKLPMLRSGLFGRRCDELLFNLSQQLHHKKVLIEELGDYIPGSVMVQDLSIMTNVYMNKSGCDILKHSSEELASLGPDYFKIFFPKEEIDIQLKTLQAFIQRNDPESTTSFFQRVRPDVKSDYKWYLTMSRLCVSAIDPGSKGLMHVSIDAASLNTAEHKLGLIIDENKFISKNLNLYNRLTKREKQILKLIASGKSCSAISDVLFLSLHTVHNHRKHIYKKLEITSFPQLMRYAMEFFEEG